jgi:Protein of unknown function (DUF3866)
MALSLKRGVVSRIGEEHEELIRLEVDGVPCVAYPRLTGAVEVGDDVVVNVQARELGLGSGGFDVLYLNLTRGLGGAAEPGAHVMKLPYTPLQHSVRHVEEDDEIDHPGLAGLPVACCTLHSQVLPVLAGAGELRCVYIQVAGGALPIPLSDALRLTGVETVAVGACFGGAHSAVSVAGALRWAAQKFDAAVCCVGPGIVGTGSAFGHGAVAAAEAANAARALDGMPVIAPRVSDADERERHRGVSHHTVAVIELTFGEVSVAWPQGWEVPDELEGRELERVDSSGWRGACEGLPLSHMGRGPDDDPRFFESAFAAGVAARHLRTL